MVLYVPFKARNSYFLNNLKSHVNRIEIIFFKNIPVIGGNIRLNNFLFKYNLANPLYQNVLIASIFIAIKMKFKDISLWGADHSWLPNIKVLQDNSIVLNDKHLSQSNQDIVKIIEEDGTNKKLHTFIFQLALMFKEYHQISSYTKTNLISINNCTKDSYIDAFNKIAD